MKTMHPAESRENEPHVKPKDASGKGKTRLLPAGTIERALQGRAKGDQRDAQGRTGGAEDRNA